MKHVKNGLIILSALMLSGCEIKPQSSEKTIFAMDTVMSLKAYGDDADTAVEKAAEEIYRLDNLLDRQDGEISNADNELSDEVIELICTATEISKKTDGMFDITIAPIMDLWGFNTKEYRVPKTEEIAQALKKVGYEKISLNGKKLSDGNGVQLDFGGIAKGYTSERVKDIFSENGIKSGMISLGGNIEAVGTKPDGSEWNVAIQSPKSDTEYAGVVKVSDKAVITSGDYQRVFEENGEKYHHIINPKNGYPANSGLSSVTVISENSTEADALSTALFVMGLDKAEEYWRNSDGFEMVLITAENDIYVTDGIEFESDNEYRLIKR